MKKRIPKKKVVNFGYNTSMDAVCHCKVNLGKHTIYIGTAQEIPAFYWIWVPLQRQTHKNETIAMANL